MNGFPEEYEKTLQIINYKINIPEDFEKNELKELVNQHFFPEDNEKSQEVRSTTW